MATAEIRYARSGDVSLAYRVLGEGNARDLIFVHGFSGNLEAGMRQPEREAFLRRLASSLRVVEFDRRGTGLSDRVRDIPSLETRMDDLRAVMDDAGSEKAAIFGTFEAASMAMLFAASHPERVGCLVLYNPVACGVWSPEYPFARTEEEWRGELENARTRWGTPEYAAEMVRLIAPTRADDPGFVDWMTSSMRLGASPGAAVGITRMAMDVDVRDVLPSIRVPALVLHRPFAEGEARYVAERIPNARRVEIGGPDTAFFLAEGLLGHVERFVGEAWQGREPDTVLATLLFTDIVGSTALATELGDARWRDLVGRHHALVRRGLDRFGGRELDTAGDGFFAAFEGPIRAIRCARTITAGVRELGLEVRAGVHTGECEVVGEKLGGIAVNIGARVSSLAEPGEVLVTSTVKDLVTGSGIEFRDRGAARLKGVPGEWTLYAVA